ncbi:unnamed protein product, partial [marine sediment metagenome]
GIESAVPTFDYGTMATLSAPVVQDASFTWGQLRGFQTMDTTIENTVDEIPDSNQLTGVRLSQADRIFRANGDMFTTSDGSTETYEWDETILLAAPVDAATWTIGEPQLTDTGLPFNAYRLNVKNLQVDSSSYGKTGSVTVANMETHATATAANDEFSLLFT